MQMPEGDSKFLHCLCLFVTTDPYSYGEIYNNRITDLRKFREDVVEVWGVSRQSGLFHRTRQISEVHERHLDPRRSCVVPSVYGPWS